MSPRLLAVSILIATISTNALALDIVSGGESAYAIVVPNEPLESVTYAAAELQTYVQRITGAELPVVAEADAPDAARIFVGPCAATEAAGIETPKWERFIARVVDGDLFIVGGDTEGKALDRATRTGTLYGVYGIRRAKSSPHRRTSPCPTTST